MRDGPGGPRGTRENAGRCGVDGGGGGGGGGVGGGLVGQGGFYCGFGRRRRPYHGWRLGRVGVGAGGVSAAVAAGVVGVAGRVRRRGVGSPRSSGLGVNSESLARGRTGTARMLAEDSQSAPGLARSSASRALDGVLADTDRFEAGTHAVDSQGPAVELQCHSPLGRQRTGCAPWNPKLLDCLLSLMETPLRAPSRQGARVVLKFSR